MKTAISLPDTLFDAAEQAARRLSLSRSQLYAKAIAEFVELHAQADVTKKLDQVYKERSSNLDPALRKMQQLSIGEDAW
ncbi:MAG: ChpI protein [Pirellulales bacterium]|nr:ChpI protein [Pirellulales bacterium]